MVMAAAAPSTSPDRRRTRPSGARWSALRLLWALFPSPAPVVSTATPCSSVAAFVRPRMPPPPPISSRLSSRNVGGAASGRLLLSSNGNDEDDDDEDARPPHRGRDDDETTEMAKYSVRPPPSSSSVAKSRRQFFRQQILATSATFLPTASNAAANAPVVASDQDNGYFSLRNNNNVPYIQQQQLARQRKLQRQERADRRNAAIARTKKWVPFVNVKRWDAVEKCLLEMLPVRNPVFRRLQDLIEELETFPATDMEGWRLTLLDCMAALSFLDSKRAILEPVFNQEDPTELYISKSSLGERNIEALRSRIEDLIAIASGDVDLAAYGAGGRTTVNEAETSRIAGRRARKRAEDDNAAADDIDDIDMEGAGEIDVRAFAEAKRKAFMALSELGELLVPSFPYAVPNRGKFGYLPRLLGRCSVTLSFERPSSRSSAFGIKFGSIGGGDGRFLGNVTIIADGYAAPITAGNFVDLSNRQFYTGLSVKAMRKRLGVVPTWSDNVIVNDLTELKDNLEDSALEFQETQKKYLKDMKGGGAGGDLRGGSGGGKTGGAGAGGMGSMGSVGNAVNNIFRAGRNGDDPFASSESIFDENRMTAEAVLPILGSFQEGFYDPLTAKPRRIPLEVVTLDPSSPTRGTLTYSSSYATLESDDDDSAGGKVAGAGNAGTTTYSALASSSSAQRSFSSSTSSSSSNSTASTYSNLEPVLSFRIPGLVALNHPDRASNGGSSEFFALPRGDSKQAKLLDGQYAPFGYVVSGSDVYQSLRPGDVISATRVSEVGLLNLVKIRKNAFEGAGEEDVAEEKGGNEDG